MLKASLMTPEGESQKRIALGEQVGLLVLIAREADRGRILLREHEMPGQPEAGRAP
jgi:hypothetical protein